MTRSLMKYQYLADERARNVTLRKRKASLFKKMAELKCLCDVDATLVMYEKADTQVDVWPSYSEACSLIQKLQNSTIMGARSMVDQNAYLQTSIAKIKKHLEKEHAKNIKRLVSYYAFDKYTLDQNDQGYLEGVHDALENEINLLDLMIKNASERAKEKLV